MCRRVSNNTLRLYTGKYLPTCKLERKTHEEYFHYGITAPTMARCPFNSLNLCSGVLVAVASSSVEGLENLYH